MLDLIVRYSHFLAIFVLFSALFAEHLLLKPKVDRATLKKLVILDAIYGASALVVLAMGLILWFGVGKPASFYNTNWILHLKVSLFVLVGLLSIVPTLFFMRQRSQQTEWVSIPKHLIIIVRVELCLLVVIPLLAVFMAHGIGLR